MEDKEKQPVTVAQLKEAGIDKLVAGLAEAIDKEDDEEKPDPFADKVAKYVPQGK